MANIHGALFLYEEAQETHYKAHGLLLGHAIEIFRDYAALRALDYCAEAVPRSPISYLMEFLLQAPRNMRTPRHSGLIERMKEKRDSCYKLVQELNCAKIAPQMRLPGPEEVEHDNKEC